LKDVTGAATVVTGLAHRIQILQESLAGKKRCRTLGKPSKELGDLQHRFEAARGYDIEHEAKSTLAGLGFKESGFRPAAPTSPAAG